MLATLTSRRHSVGELVGVHHQIPSVLGFWLLKVQSLLVLTPVFLIGLRLAIERICPVLIIVAGDVAGRESVESGRIGFSCSTDVWPDWPTDNVPTLESVGLHSVGCGRQYGLDYEGKYK